MTEETGNDRKHSRRVRRPMDLFLTVSALCSLAVVLVVIHGLPAGSGELSNDLTRAVRSVPHWLTVGGALVTLVGSFALVPVALSALLRREARGALNAAVAASAATVLSLMASLIWNSQRGALDRIVLHGSNPSILVYDCAFLAFLTGSDLVRRGRWTRWCVLSGTALLAFDVASGALAPLALPISLLGGLFVGWLVRWLLGTAATRLTAARIITSLGAADVSLCELHETAGSRGARLTGQLRDATPVEVLIASRDTRGSGLTRRVWSFVRLRPVAAGRPSLSSRSRLERWALSSCLAERGGVLVPRVLAMRELEADTLVLVTTPPTGRPPHEGEEPGDIARLFSALRLLHDAGVAHRDLRSRSLVLVDGAAGFFSLDSAQPGASDLVQRLDVTQLLTTAARCSSPAIAIKALREAYKPVDESAIAAVLQPLALAPWGWSEMRAAKGCLNEMRLELVGPDAELPETSLERFRWRTVLSAVALVAAAFVLVGQLSKVDLAGALAHASLPWCAVALVASAVGNVAAAENLAAFVPKHLSVLRSSAVQLATAFVGIAMPSTVSHVAVNSRYLHRQGVEQSAVAAAVAVSQVVNIVTTVLLLLVIGLLTGSGVSRLKLAPSGTLLVALGALITLIGVLLLVPRTRVLVTRNLWPRLRSVWPWLLQALSNPLRLALGGGANLLLSASYVLAFVAALRAVGAHPAILPAAAVFLAGNAVGSAAPTPGGVGAVEAVLSAGLSAIGIPVHQAIPAVLVFRLATFWLPIPAGWVSFTLLQRRGVL
jgi:uncharacterized membrane protein YbhN (UPF0104 family)